MGNVHPLTGVFGRKLDGPACKPCARIEVELNGHEASHGCPFRLKLVL